MKDAPPTRHHGTRVEHLAHTLTQDIATGALRPGDRLHYEDLELEYAVSRTVVREALRILEGKGLVEARPHVGTRITDPRSWYLLDPQLLHTITAQDPEMHQHTLRVCDALDAHRELLGANRLTDYMAGALHGALEHDTPQPA